MRKLKLQMQISLDGKVTADKGGTGFNWDNEVRTFSIANTEEVDYIILGRNTATGFIPHWASVAANPDDPDYVLGKRLTDIPKIVFSNTLAKSQWSNTELAKGETVEEINRLKKQAGKDMLVYGGSSFVSFLIKEGLIDQYYLLVNPVAIGNGINIFQSLKSNLVLTLLESRQFSCGTVLLIYEPKR
jgi:dihydrofolate reductase